MSLNHLVNSKGETQLAEAAEADLAVADRGTKNLDAINATHLELKLLNARIEEAFDTRINEKDIS